MKIDLSRIGKITASTFGAPVLRGIIKGYIKNLDAWKCIQYIREKKDLAIDIEQFTKWQGMLEQLPLEQITPEDVLAYISTLRPDIADIILNHPDGIVWLQHQVDNIKKLLND